MKITGLKIAVSVLLISAIIVVIGVFWPARTVSVAKSPDSVVAQQEVRSFLKALPESESQRRDAERVVKQVGELTKDNLPEVVEAKEAHPIEGFRYILREYPNSAHVEKTKELLNEVPVPQHYQSEYD